MSWLEGSGANWPNDEEWASSFDECISAYFDNLALDDEYAKALKNGNVSKEEADKASTFSKLAYLYIEPSEDPEDIFKDPEWIEIVALAKEFWSYLKRTVTSQREIELIAKLEEDFI